MAYKGQYISFCIRFETKHYTFVFLLSPTMKERGERMDRKMKENEEETSDTVKYTSENFPLGNRGIVQWMI